MISFIHVSWFWVHTLKNVSFLRFFCGVLELHYMYCTVNNPNEAVLPLWWHWVWRIELFSFEGGADDWQFVYEPWHPPNCQNIDCTVPRKNTPTSICLDASYAAAQCSSSPPVFICTECAELATHDIPEESLLVKIIQPMGKMRTTCETKECKGQGKPCSVMCFSYECVKDNR